MTVSAAKLEANRRNARGVVALALTPVIIAQSSMPSPTACGPRHWFCSMKIRRRSKTGERPGSIALCLRMTSSAGIVEDAVVSTWQLDRARRAQIARLNLNILNHGVDQAQTNEEEVQELGRRLFNDRLGPLRFIHRLRLRRNGRHSARAHRSTTRKTISIGLDYWFCACNDPPGLRMAAWPMGSLKAILDRGQPWLSSDKLKAVRLLGKQPFDAIDDATWR